MAHVKQTKVTVQGNALVKGTVNGGGESGDVWKDTEVVIDGNCNIGLPRVGSGHLPLDSLAYSGNVFGGSWGSDSREYVNMGRVYGNTKVQIKGGHVLNCVYGGGEYASVGTWSSGSPLLGTGRAQVIIEGGEIGPEDGSGRNACVFGGGMGVEDEECGHTNTAGVNYNEFGQVFYSDVQISGGTVYGNVFGGGRMGTVGKIGVTPTSTFGHTSVSISGGTIGDADNSSPVVGNVYGGGKGNIDRENYALTFNTEVSVSGGHVTGSMFGGSEDGQVGYFKAATTDPVAPEINIPGSTHVLVSGGNVGTSGNTAAFKGYVYGGGRGFHIDPNDPEAGEVLGKVNGYTRVDVTGGHIWQYVFGGGNQSVVSGHKCVNMVNGTVHKDIYGGSNATSGSEGLLLFLGLKTVNIYGGSVRNVYGCSRYAVDAEDSGSKGDEAVTAFVNISGGTITGRIHGAGHADEVQGSVVVSIGANAINSNPYAEENVDKDNIGVGTHLGYTAHTAHALNISGSVYGGSDYMDATNNDVSWKTQDISGSSNIYIDGTGYNTTVTDPSTTNYMNISGQVYGSGTHCESGARGRNIFISHYGEPVTFVNEGITTDTVTSATRNLTTIQRCGNLVIDNSNFLLTGAKPIDGSSEDFYSVFKVDTCMYVANASALGLGLQFGEGGSMIPAQIANMDSIRRLQSAYLTTGTIYSNKYAGKLRWSWIGLKDAGSSEADQMIYMPAGEPPTVLDKADENVILFNGETRLYVRYHQGSAQKYGELQGFFRMISPFKPKGLHSFAFARPKLLESPTNNTADGGFLSYNTAYNVYEAPGYNASSNQNYTNTRQYPYTNVIEATKDDVQDYRMWVEAAAFEGQCWYVDGTRGFGLDEMDDDRGLFPDKPKLSVSGAAGVFAGTKHDAEDEDVIPFDYYGNPDLGHTESDIIFVVGPIKDVNEFIQGTHEGMVNRHDEYELKLYRYPGGHEMSNGHFDLGPSAASNDEKGPGPNYGAMLNVTGDKAITLKNVYMDGLYGHTVVDQTYLKFKEHNIFDQSLIDKPLVVTANGANLTMEGSYVENSDHTIKSSGTVLTRGYNMVDASNENYYVSSEYTTKINGGGLYVHEGATVNVEGLVRILDNRQKNGTEAILSNVYLPKFETHLNITNSLAENSRIGVTSPVKNNQSIYTYNTFSPIAVADKDDPEEGENEALALEAWTNENFRDDMGRFFRNGGKSTYYSASIDGHPGFILESGTNKIPIATNKTIFLGWTWANIVRTEPAGFIPTENNPNGDIVIDSPEDLAWLISKVNGLNGQTANDLSEYYITNNQTKKLRQTADVDTKKYVWVPIGSENAGCEAFSGTYDGQGHLIKNIYVDYIGVGDGIYAPMNKFGLFGLVRGAKINRTFVVGGHIHPVGTASSGGLAGWVEKRVATTDVFPEIANSEAAIEITCPTSLSEVASGGLIGFLLHGNVHSSMSMSELKPENGYACVGGLIGRTGDPIGLINTGEITVKNSFANVKFTLPENPTGIMAGGLIGYNYGAAEVDNCYSSVQTGSANLDPTNFGLLTFNNPQEGQFKRSYYPSAMGTYHDCITNMGTVTNCAAYTPVISADVLGYMYEDNKIVGDTALFARLNVNLGETSLNGTSGHTYSRWARPALAEINSDLPVLLLDEGANYQGDFRSVGTYAGGPALQYGGPIRDDNQISDALKREKASTANDCLFVYGDISENTTVESADITQTKVSVYEHASITDYSTLKNCANTYVGITFDNSFGKAYSSPGINAGLGNIGEGGYPLPRDWHMFSSPLSNAPLGFDYGNDNVANSTNKNNPWTTPNNEFSWLTNIGRGRYWMEDYDTKDGYFPTSRGTLFGSLNDADLTNQQRKALFIEGSDECPQGGSPRYPYGMDLLTWTEPDYHWINFKRNGPNHWHSDEPHAHLDYKPYGIENEQFPANVNEDNLIVGRGYMASIAKPTMLQSHGMLNTDLPVELENPESEKQLSIPLTISGANLTGWNLVGNPYHGYLDFDALGDANEDVLATKDNVPFYVIYDADQYVDEAYTAYKCYPKSGSPGGAYAGQYLHPHQGFYVKAAKTGNLVFNENMIVTRNTLGTNADGHFRGSWDDNRPAYPLVNLYLSSKRGCADVTVVEFERPEWSGALKMKELRCGNGLFYARHDEQNYAALFTEKGAERVPLWFEAKEDDIFTIRWNTANGDFLSMYLVDNMTGVTYDMLANESYTFQGHVGDYPSRFYIVFKLYEDPEEPEEPEEPEGDSHNFVFFDGSEWVVTGDGMLDFIDMQGRILSRNRLTGGQSRVSMPPVAAGVYMFRLTNGEETKVQKVIVTNY